MSEVTDLTGRLQQMIDDLRRNDALGYLNEGFMQPFRIFLAALEEALTP
jgi:hypothetical protein